MLDIAVDAALGDIFAVPLVQSLSDTVLINGPCRLIGWSIRAEGISSPQDFEGQAVAPGAGGNVLAPQVVPDGVYDVNWQVQLIGAAAAADQDNFKLTLPDGKTLISANAGAAGLYPQEPVQASAFIGGQVSVVAVGAGTAAVTYLVQVTLVPSKGISTRVEIQDGNSPLGEVAVTEDSASTQWFGLPGVRVRQQVKAHIIAGFPSGCVYVAYEQAY